MANLKGNISFFVLNPASCVNQIVERYQCKKTAPELLSITNALAFKPIIRSTGMRGLRHFDQTWRQSRKFWLYHLKLWANSSRLFAFTRKN